VERAENRPGCNMVVCAVQGVCRKGNVTRRRGLSTTTSTTYPQSPLPCWQCFLHRLPSGQSCTFRFPSNSNCAAIVPVSRISTQIQLPSAAAGMRRTRMRLRMHSAMYRSRVFGRGKLYAPICKGCVRCTMGTVLVLVSGRRSPSISSVSN
jgi:hypothetical protein